MFYTPRQNNLGTITCSPLFGISKRGGKFIFILTFWWWISIVGILEHTEHCCKTFSKQFSKRFGCDLGLGKLYFAHFTFFSLAFIFLKSDFWVNLYFEGNHKLQPFLSLVSLIALDVLFEQLHLSFIIFEEPPLSLFLLRPQLFWQVVKSSSSLHFASGILTFYYTYSHSVWLVL